MTKPILIGESRICEYIGISSGNLFRDLLRKGLPARQINGRWYAHAENIDDYFKRITRFKNKPANVPE